MSNVITMANTPSLNASTRFLLIGLLLPVPHSCLCNDTTHRNLASRWTLLWLNRSALSLSASWRRCQIHELRVAFLRGGLEGANPPRVVPCWRLSATNVADSRQKIVYRGRLRRP